MQLLLRSTPAQVIGLCQTSATSAITLVKVLNDNHIAVVLRHQRQAGITRGARNASIIHVQSLIGPLPGSLIFLGKLLQEVGHNPDDAARQHLVKGCDELIDVLAFANERRFEAYDVAVVFGKRHQHIMVGEK